MANARRTKDRPAKRARMQVINVAYVLPAERDDIAVG
jgi:hypothetical protein